jgi:hypothetical protein
MPAKNKPGLAKFQHYGRTITVEMVDPKVGSDGRVNIEPARYTYEIPLNKRGAIVNVVGLITRATFEVTGWRHPIRFTTSNIGFGDPVIIQHIAIGKLGALGIMEYQDVELDNLPLGKMREAARRAATFTGTLKTRTKNKSGKVTSRHRYLRISELNDQPIQNIRVGGRLTNKQDARFGAKLDLENVRELLPIDDPRSLTEIARWYEHYYKIGRAAAGYVNVRKYIAIQTGRPENTVNAMITRCRAEKLLPKQTKRKRGAK